MAAGTKVGPVRYIIGGDAAYDVGSELKIVAGANVTCTWATVGKRVTLTIAATGGGSGAPTNASYVVMGVDGTLTDERQLAEGHGIDITDGGAGSTVTIAVDEAELTYGSTAGKPCEGNDSRLSDARVPPDGDKGDVVVSDSGATWLLDSTIAGTAGGRTIYGGNAANDDLHLYGTSHATAGYIYAHGDLVVGDAGTEAGGVSINGSNYEAILGVHDIGGARAASMHLHRHSTTLQNYLLATRSATEDDTHSALASGDIILTIMAAGCTGSHYDQAASIEFLMGTGTISGTSSPGLIRFRTTADSAQTPTTRMTIDAAGAVAVVGAFSAGSITAPIGDASAPGVLKLNAAGGALPFIAQQVVSGSTTMTTDATDVYITAACTLTLPAVSASTAGRTARLHVESTTEIIVVLDAAGTDTIEGAAIAYLIATRGEYTLTPVAAGKWALTAVRGICEWLHCSVDLTAAAAGSPWSLTSSEGDTTTWTDISSASSSWAASSGLVATSKSGGGYTGSASADCAVVKVPIAELLDSWNRPLLATDTFWVVTEHEKTTAVGGSSPWAFVALAGTALSTVPRAAVYNSGGTSILGYSVRSSATTDVTTTTANITANGWLGMLWDGDRVGMTDAMLSTSPSGDPGVSGGWVPESYAHADRTALTRDYTSTSWVMGNATHLHLAQYTAATGSRFTFKHLAVLQRRGVRS